MDEVEGGGGLAEAVLKGGGTKALGVPEGLDCCEGMEVLLSLLLRLNGNLNREFIEDEDIGERRREKDGGAREEEGKREGENKKKAVVVLAVEREAKKEGRKDWAEGSAGTLVPSCCVWGERATRQTRTEQVGFASSQQWLLSCEQLIDDY